MVGTQAAGSRHWIVIALLGAMFLLWMVTESSGHTWGGDFSQYIHHAVNLVQGQPYADIGYIHTSFAYVGPESYPPFFPLLLAPVYWLFGLDWYALKFVPVAAFCAGLYFLLTMRQYRLPLPYQVTLIVLLAFNPYFWNIKDQILSDYPFMLVCFLTLALLDRRYAREAGGYRDLQRQNWGFAPLLGLLLYLCYATREIGIVLIPVLLCFELFHFRKITLVSCAAVLVFLALAGLQHASIELPETDPVMQERIAAIAAEERLENRQFSHADMINFNLGATMEQALRYAIVLRSLWPETGGRVVQAAAWTAFLLAVLFSLGGYIRAVLSGPGIGEIFVAGYVAMLLLFGGYQGLRYLVPLVPFMFYYAFSLHSELLRLRYPKLMTAVALLFAVATTVSYAANARTYSYARTLAYGITSPDATALLHYIDTSTPVDSVFVFQKPRVLTLVTGRKASTQPFDRFQGSLPDYMRAIGADYLVSSDIDWSGISKPLQRPTARMDDLTLEYRNDQFALYRLKPAR